MKGRGRIVLENTDCPLCECAGSVLFLKARDWMWDVPGEYTLVRCCGCGHIYLNPRPTRETVTHCYPPHYSCHRTDPGAAEADSGLKALPDERSTWSRRAARVPGLRRLYYWWVQDATRPSELIPDMDAAPRRALEIGCANGHFLSRLREAGWDVRGVEICEAPALRAQRRGLDVHVGTLESAGYADASFDAVFAWGAVPHLHDPVATFREIHRVLKRGGWFLFSFPNAACWELRFFRQFWYGLQVPTQMQHYTPDSARRLLRQTDFEIVDLTQLEDINNLIGSLGIWLRAGLPDLGCGKGLYEFTSRWTFLFRVALAPLARYLACRNQAGRIRIVARCAASHV